MSRGVDLVVSELALGYADSRRRPRAKGDSDARPVIEGLNLRLGPGERAAVIGASGTGKTTLLHALAGLLRPLAGSVTVDGRVVASPEGPCTCGHAAYMFQRDLLLPWRSALDNATLAADLARPPASPEGPAAVADEVRERAEALLREFGLGDVLDALPRQLSGGMRQRVALARTLVLSRGLVLLDEPFAGLDALTRSEIQTWMRRVMDGHAATWVLVTHDIREAVALADRVAVLGGSPAGISAWVDTSGGGSDAVTELESMLADSRRR